MGTMARMTARTDIGPEAILPHLDYLWGCARRLYRHPLMRRWYGEVEDVFQALCLAVLEYSLRLWHPDCGMPFHEYLASRATGPVFNHVDRARTKKHMACNECCWSALTGNLDVVEDRDERAAIDANLEIAAALKLLSQEDRLLLTLRWGLEDGVPRSNREVAEILGRGIGMVAREQVRLMNVLRKNFKVENDGET